MKPFSWSRRVVLVAFGQGIVKAGQLLLAAVLIRRLTDLDWSRVALLLSIYQVATGVGGLNMQQSIYFFFGRTPLPGRRDFLLQNAVLLFGSALVTAGILVGLAGRFDDGHYAIEGLVYVLALVVLIEIPTAGIGEILVASERLATATTVQVCLALLQLGAVAGPIAVTGRVEPGFYGLLIYAAVRLVVYTQVVRLTTERPPPEPWRKRLDRERLRAQLFYVAPLALALSLGLLSRNVDKWWVAAFDPTQYGSFAIVATEIPFVSMLAGASSTVLVTRLVHAFHQEDRAFAREAFVAAGGRLSLVVLPVAVGLAMVGPELLHVVFSPKVATLWLAFALTSGVLLQRIAEYGVVLRAAGDTTSLWWSSVVYLAGTTVFGFIGVHLGGALGVAVGTFLAQACAWLFALSRIRRAFRCGWAAVFPWPVYGRALAVSVGAAAVAVLVIRAMPAAAPLPTLIIKSLIFLGIYLAVVRLGRLERYIAPMPERPLA